MSDDIASHDEILVLLSLGEGRGGEGAIQQTAGWLCVKKTEKIGVTRMVEPELDETEMIEILEDVARNSGSRGIAPVLSSATVELADGMSRCIPRRQ